MNDTFPLPDPTRPLAVLVSGGVDSAVLTALAARCHPAVVPIYVRFGLTWEAAEQAHLRRFLDAVRTPALRPLVTLDQPVTDLYGAHWSLTGAGVPAAGTPDEDVFLPGRNVLLLAKSLLWCHLNGIPQVALAPLACNPFPDGTASFFAACESVLNQAVTGAVRVTLPYRGLDKTEVLLRGRDLPLEWTFSCISPREGRHCGACSKCHERRTAFAAAGLPDPTPYPTRDAACSA